MTLAIVVAGYPLFAALLVVVDRWTGWQIAEAFGKPRPGGRDAR